MGRVYFTCKHSLTSGGRTEGWGWWVGGECCFWSSPGPNRSSSASIVKYRTCRGECKICYTAESNGHSLLPIAHSPCPPCELPLAPATNYRVHMQHSNIHMYPMDISLDRVLDRHAYRYHTTELTSDLYSGRYSSTRSTISSHSRLSA